MTKNSTLFANSISQAFDQKIIQDKITGGEIKLFHALMHAFKCPLNNLAIIEEYHGANHQVTFTGNGSYARSSARCELSDLMILTFNSHIARLTYLQAKYEKFQVQNISSHKWSANLEQWFLLHKLPPIKGYGYFNPPNNLLTSALLKSIGSFGFFYKKGTSFDMYYASAEYLQPASNYTQKNGKLVFTNKINYQITKGFIECIETYSILQFCEKLYQLEIGTPITTLPPSVQNWLISILSGLGSDITKDLIKLLTEHKDIKPFQPWKYFGAKKLLLIKIND